MNELMEIREKLTEYLEHMRSLMKFQEWFMPFFWDLRSPESLALSRRVAGKLAGYTRENLPEEFLRLELVHVAAPFCAPG